MTADFHRIDLKHAHLAEKILTGRSIDDTLRTRLRQLPPRLRSSGLATTYAFLMSRAAKKDDLGVAYTELVTVIAQHVTDMGLIDTDGTPEDFLSTLATVDAFGYARIAAEVDALAMWLSRLADARYTPDDAEGHTDGD